MVLQILLFCINYNPWSFLVPSGPPTNLTVVFVNSTSMTIVWSPPEQERRNGIIVAYKVCVRRSVVTSQCQDRIVTGSQRNYTASLLSPFTFYDVIVSAATSVGYGSSSLVTNRTSEAGMNPVWLF